MPGAPTCCSRCSTPGTTVAGVFTRSKCPSAPVEWCRAAIPASRQGARAGGQFRQCQCLHRQERPRGRKFTAEIAARAAGCKPAEIFLASTGVIGEPLNATSLRRRHGRARRQRQARRLPRRGAGDHDHRHLSQGRHRARQDRQGDGDHQRHRQGRRHDRARHGDDAVVRLHRRGDRGAGLAGAAQGRRRRHASTP